MSIRKLATRTLLAGALALGTAPMALSLAYAGTGNPHSEQQDGCDHGNSNKPCKDDPQPNRGKDCMNHGNWGGQNEDHCDNGGEGSA